MSATLLSSPIRAHADPAKAADHFAAASKAFENADFKLAAQEFEAAYAEEPHPAPLYNAGLAWLRAGRQDHAAGAFAAALSMDGLAAEQKTDAASKLAEAEKVLAPVKLLGVETGAKARIDDGPLLPATSRFFASRGSREAFVTGASGKTSSRTFEVPPGSVAPIELSFEPPAAASGPFPIKLAVGIGLVGGAVIFGAAAIGTGVAGLSARDDYVAALDDPTPASGLESQREDAVSLKVATNVLWGFSAATLIGGGVLIALSLTESKPSNGAQVRVGPASVGLTVALPRPEPDGLSKEPP